MGLEFKPCALSPTPSADFLTGFVRADVSLTLQGERSESHLRFVKAMDCVGFGVLGFSYRARQSGSDLIKSRNS